MRLLFIRHAQTDDNVRGALGSIVPGPGLTELGLRQASAIPDALGSEPIQAIYTSTMLRTQLTAEPLANARGLEAEVIDGIQEIAAGDLEGETDTESIKLYMGTIFSWWTDRSARIPGSENGTEFWSRFTGAIEQIAGRHGGTVAIVSHGAAIRTWVCATSQNLDADFSRSHPLDNTAVVVVEGSPQDGWVTTYWAGEPVGGAALEDAAASDPTADAL